ncbi:hypothetical protein BurJ1DRAFT_0106 [Burkholderiales bacterium JOSHI_001]|nr:hypothetical protein BurJ1DRAFT_0106 [Burkholderiales bacterium JOSHI_001]
MEALNSPDPEMHPLKLAAATLATTATLLAASAQAADADGAGWRVELMSDHHADALRLSDLGSDDAVRALAPRTGRNLAYVEDQALLARRQGAWTIGLLARSSATLVASEDALALSAALANKATPAASRDWAVNARFAAFSGAGLLLQRAFVPAEGWQAQASAQLLSLARWRERRLLGDVRYNAVSGAYGFDLVSQRGDDRLSFPFQTAVSGQGLGALFGAAVDWRRQDLDGRVAVQDVGWLHWGRLPREAATLSTQTQALDADGFLIYKPLVQGQNSQDSGATRLKGRWQLEGGWRPQPATRLSLGLRTREGFGALPEAALQQQWGDLALGARWQFHERRLGLSVGWRGWQLAVASDRLGGGARSQAWSLGYTASP